MMRAPHGYSVAVRRADGSIALKEGPLASEQGGLRKIPGVRGVITLFESLSLGYRALQFSADQAAEDAERAGGAGPATSMLGMLSALRSMATAWALALTRADSDETPAPPKSAAPASNGTKGAMLVSTALALGLFIALPQALAAGATRLFGVDWGVTDARFHLLTGLFKLTVLTTYLVVISRIPEIRRVFQYHGAEHKTIYAYEAGHELTVDNVKSRSTLHPRCGTTFLITVVIVSVILGSILTPLLLPGATGFLGQLETLVLRIAMLPLIAAISYELQRFSARYCTTGPLRVLLYPGFLFQKITTREPDAKQIEVAIAAMEAALLWRREEAGTTEPTTPQVFASLASLREALRARAVA